MADETRLYVPGDTPDALFAVRYHVAVKGLQAGSLLGMGLLAPLAWFVSGRKKGRSFVSYLRSEAMIGSAIMVPVSLAMAHYKLKDEPYEAIADRAYRIKHNTGQQTVDHYTLLGACVGAAVGAIGFGVTPPLGFAQGGAMGFGAGVVFYMGVKLASQLQ